MCCIRKHLKVVKHSVTINITEHKVPTRQRKQIDETRRYTGVTLYSRPITSMTKTVGEMYSATREVHQARDSIQYYGTTETTHLYNTAETCEDTERRANNN